MPKTAALTFLSAMLLLLAITAPISADALEGEEIVADKTYAAGVRVKCAAVGISFKVPEGTSAKPLGNYGFYQLSPSGGSRGGLLIVRTGLTEEDIKLTLPDELDLTFIHADAYFQVADKPTTKDGKTTARYITGDTMSANAVGASSYLLVIFDESAKKAEEAVKAFEKDVVTVAPADAEARKKWRTEIESKVLTVSGGEQTVECKFTKDGKYALKISDATNSQSQTGKWIIDVSPFGGVLTLVADNGTRNYYTMTLNGSDFALNGMVYARKALEDGGSAATPEGEKLARPAEAEEKGKARKVAADPSWKTDQVNVDKLEGDEIAIGTPVLAEKRVKTDFLGVSFKHPAGMAGGVDARAPFYILKPTDGKGLGLVYMQTGVTSAAHLAAFMHEDMDLDSLEKGLLLKPDGEAKIEGGKVTQDYKHELVTARAIALIGPSGNGVIVCFIGAIADKDKMHGYAKTIIDTVQFAKPQAEEKRSELVKQLHGKYLMIYRYKSSSGASGNSSSWETKIHYHFGSDGTYYYRYKFVGDHYVKGTNPGGDTKYIAGAASENDREDKGTWRVEFNITGAIVYMTAENGVEREHQIRVANGKVFFDEEEVSIGQSDVKK
ncbi:MAG: hypothetical protein IT462_04405 [Planctomycetes bacterium]|nr:hypothetical protein [Planctomycetota bacterium]